MSGLFVNAWITCNWRGSATTFQKDEVRNPCMAMHTPFLPSMAVNPGSLF